VPYTICLGILPRHRRRIRRCINRAWGGVGLTKHGRSQALVPIAHTCFHEPCSARTPVLTLLPVSLTYLGLWQSLSLVPASLRCPGRLAGGHRSHPSSLPCSWLRCRPVRSLVMGANTRIPDWAMASKIESTASVDKRLCIDSSLDHANRWLPLQFLSAQSSAGTCIFA
jgi:hypothetical protein